MEDCTTLCNSGHLHHESSVNGLAHRWWLPWNLDFDHCLVAIQMESMKMDSVGSVPSPAHLRPMVPEGFSASLAQLIVQAH